MAGRAIGKTSRERQRTDRCTFLSVFAVTIPLRASAPVRAVPKRAYTDRMRLFKDDILSVCFWMRSLPGDGHNRCLVCLGIEHAEAAFVDESCTHCGKMTIAELRSRLSFLQRGGVPVPLPRSNPPQRVASGSDMGDLRITVSASPSGNQPPRSPHPSHALQPVEPPLEKPDHPRDDDSGPLPPSGVSAVPETDPEMMALLSRAANGVELVWNPPPCPEPSRNCSGGSSSLTTLDGGAAKGYTHIPPVERAVAMQLCPNSTWRGEPCLPSRACKYSSDLTGKAYKACGKAASAVHAMALLQVHQAKALKDLHEGGHDPQVLHELCIATDLALRAAGLKTSGTQIFNKRAVSSISGSEEGQESSGGRESLPLSSASSIASGQQCAVRERNQAASCTSCPVEPYASATGWGATYNGHAVSGVWTGPQLQLARHLLLWSQKHLRSFRAMYVPGVLNRVADELSRAVLPGEWGLHPQAVQLIWREFGEAQVDLFASSEISHCQLFYSLTEGTLFPVAQW
ncbi:hypothetical protein PO909_019027 [Leuciscus waleckii]